MKRELTVRQANNRLDGEMRYRGSAAIEYREKMIRREIADLEAPIGTVTIAGDLSSTADQERLWELLSKRKKELEEKLEKVAVEVRQQIAEEIAEKYTITDGELRNGRFLTYSEIERMENQSDEPEYVEYVYEIYDDDQSEDHHESDDFDYEVFERELKAIFTEHDD